MTRKKSVFTISDTGVFFLSPNFEQECSECVGDESKFQFTDHKND